MSKKILIVEGDPSASAEFKGELEGKGFVVDETSDSKRVIEAMRAQKPDLVILAVELSAGQNGYLVCGKIKKDDELKSTPIVILGSPDGFGQHRKLKTRADEYVAKPVDLAELSQKIGELIGFPETSSVEIVEESLTLSDLVEEPELGFHLAEEPKARSSEETSAARSDSDLEMLDAAFEQLSLRDGEHPKVDEEPVEAPPEGSEPEETVAEALDGRELSVEAEAAFEGLAEEAAISSGSEVSIDIDEGALLSDLAEESAPEFGTDHAPESAFSETMDEPDSRLDAGGAIAEPKEAVRNWAEPGAAKGDQDALTRKLKSDLNRRDQEIQDLREREMKLEQELAHSFGEVARRDAQIQTLSTRADQMTAERRKVDQQLTTAREEARAAASKISLVQRELSEVRSEQAEAQKAREELEADAQSARREAEEAQRELESMKLQLTQQSEEGVSLRQRVAELEEATQKHEERVSRFYQKFKDDEKIRDKAKKALSIALQLLEEQRRLEVEDDDEPAEA